MNVLRNEFADDMPDNRGRVFFIDLEKFCLNVPTGFFKQYFDFHFEFIEKIVCLSVNLCIPFS